MQKDSIKTRSIQTTVSHHKLERQNYNIPPILKGKMWFWLLQIQAVPPCRSPRYWPHPCLLTEEQRPSPRDEPAFLCLYAPLLISRGRPRTSSPSVQSTYQEQRLNSSPGIIKQFNELGGDKKVTESEWAKKETSRGKRARKKELSFVCLDRMTAHQQVLHLTHKNTSTLLSSPILSSCNITLTARCWWPQWQRWWCQFWWWWLHVVCVILWAPQRSAEEEGCSFNPGSDPEVTSKTIL